MKKSALILLTLFYSSTLLLLSATPSLAQTDLDCTAADVLKIMKADTCQAVKDLFQNNQVDGPWYNQNPTQFAKKITDAPADEIFGERYTYAQINWIVNSIATMLNPASGITNPKQLFDFINAIRQAIAQVSSGQPLAFSDYAKLGPAGLFAGGVSALYTNPPASGVGEVKYMAGKLFDYTTGTQPAYAQGGYGFSGLGGNSGSAVRALWSASRNMAYLIMIILLIASGFLIMFRVKINPQTVVSLQVMIPKLIITMLLVTFSFAIAGLVIDLIYVFIAAFVGMLSLSGATPLVSDVPKAISFLTSSGFEKYLFVQILTPLLFWFAISFLIGTIVSIASAGALLGPSTIGIILVVIIVAIVYLITLFKIFWMLIKTYIVMVLQICIAPLYIMLDLIPGQQGFGPWLRNFIANASVFAVVPIMLVIQNVLTGDLISGNLFLYISGSFNSLGGSTLNLPFLRSPGWIISFAGGFVIFTMTPKIADMIRDMLKIPAFKYGTNLSEIAGGIITTSKLVGVGSDISKQVRDVMNTVNSRNLTPSPTPPTAPRTP